MSTWRWTALVFAFGMASVSAISQSANPNNEYVLIYNAVLRGSYTGEDIVVQPVPAKPVCVGSLPPPQPFDTANFPQFYPVTFNGSPLACTAGSEVQASVPVTASGGQSLGSPVIKTTMGITENVGVLSSNISSTVNGVYDFGGGNVEEILFRPDIPTVYSPGTPVVFTFHLHQTGTPAPNSGGTTGGRVGLSVTVASDNDVQSFQGSIGSQADQTLTMPALTIGASQKYTLYVDFITSATGAGTGNVTPLQNASLNAEFIMQSYVALGDSYASGAGDPPYGPGPQDVTCQRSQNGVPVRLNEPLGLIFAACSGANVSALYNGQGSKQPTPQFDYLDNTASLVSIMIGGNDAVNISQILEFCTLGGIFRPQYPTYVPGLPCGLQTMTAGGPDIAQMVGSNLATLHGALRSAYLYIRQKAPKARVIVPTYPNPFNSGATDLICQNYTPINGQDGQFYWLIVDELNRVVRTAAAEANVEAIDLNNSDNSEFPQAGVCSPVSLFYTIGDSLRNGGLQNLTATFHPNSQGEAEMARIIKDYLNGNSGPPINNSLNIQPGQNASTTVNVTPGQSTAMFGTQWPGSDIVMSLVSPSGEVINRNTTQSSVLHTLGSTFEIYEITLPQPGKWTVNFYGAEVATGGEQLKFSFSQLPRAPGDADGDGVATCADIDIVKAAFGSKAGQSGFNPAADLNNDGVVNVLDLSLVARNLLTGTTCQ